MEDAEGGLSFDFEGGLDAAVPANGAPVHRPPSDAAAIGDGAAPPVPAPAADAAAGGGPGARRSFRKTVCRHWLRGLCMKGEACGFLHQYDKDRMPVCRFFGLYGGCRKQDCPYKHTTDDIKECNMYKLGFCPNGPDCRYRHAKLPGPPPPVEEVFQKLQQMSSSYGHLNRFFHGRNVGYMHQADKYQVSQVAGAAGESAVEKLATAQEPSNLQQQPQPQPHPQPQMQPQPQIQQSQQHVNHTQFQNIQNGVPSQTVRIVLPLPQGQSRCVWSF